MERGGGEGGKEEEEGGRGEGGREEGEGEGRRGRGLTEFELFNLWKSKLFDMPEQQTLVSCPSRALTNYTLYD